MNVNTDVLPKLTLTVEEAAELLRIGRGSAYELVRSGRLRAIKIGRRIPVARDGKTYTYWQARYSAGFDPGTGKQKQHSITGKTQKEVLQKLKAATVAIDSGSYIEPSAMTVAQWLQSWSDNYLEGIKPRPISIAAALHCI